MCFKNINKLVLAQAYKNSSTIEKLVEDSTYE